MIKRKYEGYKKNFVRYFKYFLNREMDLFFIVSNVKVNWMGILYIVEYNMFIVLFYYYMC